MGGLEADRHIDAERPPLISPRIAPHLTRTRDTGHATAARKEIAEAAETKVHLFLFVKVRENWSDDPERYREMGLTFPKG